MNELQKSAKTFVSLGYTVNGASSVTKTYENGVVARIKADGSWKVWNVINRKIPVVSGAAGQHPCYAAMDANEAAWKMQKECEIKAK